eukprot:m.110864 g.110864  ORF g.110864 m.110864 type:complete len:93 (-) comp15278_c0_seq1:98-376(-)
MPVVALLTCLKKKPVDVDPVFLGLTKARRSVSVTLTGEIHAASVCGANRTERARLNQRRGHPRQKANNIFLLSRVLSDLPACLPALSPFHCT